jgi:hypothetical protein
MLMRALPIALALGLAAAPALAADTYDVSVAQAKATVGAKATASVVVTGKNGWHLNEEFPISLVLKPDASVNMEKKLLGRKDLAESTKEKARFEVAFTASEAGKKNIDAEARFAICQASACKPVTEKVVLPVEVTAAAPPAAAPAPAPAPEPKGKAKPKTKKRASR